MRTCLKTLMASLLMLISLSLSAAHVAGEVLTVTLDAGDYEITTDEKGLQRIRMDDFGSLVKPGEPWLPGRIFYIALPPLAEVHSVTVEGIAPQELPDTYTLSPRPPILPQMEIGPEWRRNILREFEMRRRESYNSDQAFPEKVGYYLGTGGLRKYTFARVSFSPLTYFPRSGRLVLYPSARVSINYTAPGMTDQVRRLLSDRKMEDRAAETLINYHQAQRWYPRQMFEGKAEDWDYIIIATDSMSASCDTLKDWKEDLGYDVKVVTTTWINSNYAGADLPARIRAFLQDKYLENEWGIEYVLIAGDDDHIPMRRCFPDPTNHRAASDTTTPTDYYYADLTGDWDSDGDGFPGEYGQDNVDWVAEVYVGRIASNDADGTHDICKKLVKFEAEDASSWKYDALLLGAFSNFENEDHDTTTVRTDGADLMEDMITDMLGTGWSTTTMYEKAGRDTSDYLCNTPLTHNNAINDWSTGSYGIVNWWGHGNWNGASRKWWSSDDGDGVPEAAEMSWQRFIENADAPSLDDAHPSIVFANSCLCGQPDAAGKCLGQTLLEQGSSGMVASTRVSWYFDGWDSHWDGGNASIDYYFFEELLNNDKKLGEALFDAKVTHDSRHVTMWHEQMNMFDFCLYGDPSMIWQGGIPSAVSDTISNDTTWTVSQSPYIIENRLYIRGTDGGDNVTTLTINPGVHVVFGEDGALVVGSASSTRPGALVADGKPDSLIVFTSASDTTKNEPDDWMGLEFLDYSNDATCKLDNCLIEYARDGIYCLTASPTITNCLIRNVYRHGIGLYSNSDPTITNTVVHHCGQVGIRLSTNCDPTMYGDSVATSRYGLFVEYSSPSVDSCLFMNNTEDGIYISGNTAGPTISNCDIRYNETSGINALGQSIPVISSCTIRDNGIWGISIGGVAGARIYGNTITHHDSIAGIEIQGASDTVRVHSNTLTDNYTGLFLNYSTSSSPTVIYYNTIGDNDYGISIEDTASISIHHNDILGNTTRNLNYGPIDTLVAEYNWWGATRSDSIEVGLGGYGVIDYVPFLTNTYHAPWVEVTSPNGGEVVGDTTNITWVAPDVDGDSVSVNIFYSSDGGNNFFSLAFGEDNDGTYPWDTTPYADGSQYLIKLFAYDGTYQSWDVSDAIFTLYNPDAPQVMLVHPVGGEILVDSTTIWWWANDPDLGDSASLDVDIDYSSDAGTTWTVIDSNLINDCFHGWNVSDLEDGDQYMVRVTVTDTTGLSTRDSSDTVFQINNPDPPAVRVLSPNGWEHWSGTHDIIWTGSDPDSAEGLIYDLYVGIATASDTSWTQLLNNSSDTSYSWYTQVYSDWGAYYAKVVVEDPDALSDQDLSNHSFTVDNTPPPMPSYLYLDAQWDPVTGLGTVDLSWEDVIDTLSPPEFYQVFQGTSDDNIDYNTPIYSGSANACTIDSLSAGPHYFGLKARDNADQPNWVTYQKSKGTNGEGVYFTTATDFTLSFVVSNSNGVVTGTPPNFLLDGSVVLTYPNLMFINYENLTAGDSHGHHALRVYGRLVAHKSAFTAGSAGDWRGIVFADSSMDYDTTAAIGCQVDSCTIRHAVNGIYSNWSSPMINGNEISHCSNAGINCFWSGAIIQNNDAGAGGIHHNTFGIWEDGEGPTGGGILLRDNEVRDNSAGMHFGNMAQPTIKRNLIHDNFIGAEFQTGAFPAQFDRNDIYNNLAYGVENDSVSVLVTAENNWWGAASGPSGQGSGSGDAVSNNVDFSPFLTFPTGSDVANWCQLISPDSIRMDVGDTTQTILGQIYEPGITPGGGQGAGIAAQVGYGPNNTEASGAGWSWSPASYVRDVGNNDEYGGTVTVSRIGTYDYAFRFSKDDSITWVYADLDGNNQGAEGTNGYTVDQAGDLTVGYVLNPVVVIDDDLGSWQNNYHNALSNNGINFDTWDVSAQGSPPAGLLNKYQVVVWETGEDTANTLTDDDENNLMAYLDNGGHLFLSSKGYLTEVGPRPFISDYLHVDMWINDVTGIEREWGEPGDVIADGLNLELEWPLNTGTDDMIPRYDAAGIFHNDHYKSGKQMNFGGLRYPIAVAKGSYRLVFFSFPFEAISDLPDPDNQNTVMDRVMDWLITDTMPPEALMAGDMYPGYVPLTWSPPGSHVDTLQIHDGTFEGRIGVSDSGEVLAAILVPESHPCVLRTLIFHVADWPPMTVVDMYVFADTSAPGEVIAGPYEVITSGHGDGWVLVDVWGEQIAIDDGDVCVGVVFRASWDTYVSADRTLPFQDRSWWGETIDGPWYPFSAFTYPLNVSDVSISAVVTYQDSSSKLLGNPNGVHLAESGLITAQEGGKAFLGYNIYRGEMKGGPYSFLGFAPKEQTTYQDSSVIGGEQYWYVVSATYHQEETGTCNEEAATPRSMLPPMAVDDLRIAVEVGDIHLSWTPVSLDTAGHSKKADHYVIYRVTDPGAAIGDLDSMGTSYQDDYVDSGAVGDTEVHYFYAVKAVDCDDAKSVESNRVGEFDMQMKDGTK